MTFRRSFDSERRRFLTGALGLGVAFSSASRIFAAVEFWKTKDPSDWTEEEVNALVTKSPWVRLATPSFKHNEEPVQSNGGGRGGMGDMARGHSIDALVRWESAQPILDAMRAPLPADFAGHYVLSVSNFPIAPPPRPGRSGGDTPPDDALERLQNGATLQTRTKGPVEAGIAHRSHVGSILFGFLKDELPLTANDRDIAFALDDGEVSIKTKFDGKDMVYHGKLAV